MPLQESLCSDQFWCLYKNYDLIIFRLLWFDWYSCGDHNFVIPQQHSCYTRPLSLLSSSHWVLFYKVYSKHLGLSAKEWGLLSILEGSPFWSSLSNISPEAVPKLLADFLSLEIYARAAEVFWLPDILSGLRSCHLIDNLILSRLAGFFRIFLVPKGSLLYRSSEILGDTAPRLWVISRELFSLTSFFVVQWKIMSLGIYSLIYYSLTLVCVFPINYVE